VLVVLLQTQQEMPLAVLHTLEQPIMRLWLLVVETLMDIWTEVLLVLQLLVVVEV
jgi:hypothetical protein